MTTRLRLRPNAFDRGCRVAASRGAATRSPAPLPPGPVRRRPEGRLPAGPARPRRRPGERQRRGGAPDRRANARLLIAPATDGRRQQPVHDDPIVGHRLRQHRPLLVALRRPVAARDRRIRLSTPINSSAAAQNQRPSTSSDCRHAAGSEPPARASRQPVRRRRRPWSLLGRSSRDPPVRRAPPSIPAPRQANLEPHAISDDHRIAAHRDSRTGRPAMSGDRAGAAPRRRSSRGSRHGWTPQRSRRLDRSGPRSAGCGRRAAPAAGDDARKRAERRRRRAAATRIRSAVIGRSVGADGWRVIRSPRLRDDGALPRWVKDWPRLRVRCMAAPAPRDEHEVRSPRGTAQVPRRERSALEIREDDDLAAARSGIARASASAANAGPVGRPSKRA